jgi:hypothetical protein
MATAATIDTNLVVLDVATRWRIDAALTLTASAAFLGWSIAARGAARSLIAFVVEIAAGLLIERWVGLLPGVARLAAAAPLPAGARERSGLRYAVDGVIWTLALCAVPAALSVVLNDASFYGGWLAAFAIMHLLGAVHARRIERRDQVRLRVAVGSWRNRRARYYVTSPALWGVSRG